MRVRVLLLASVLSCTLAAAQEPEPLVEARSLRAIAATAQKLARAGLEEETAELQAILVGLGQPEADATKLAQSCEKDLAKAKRRNPSKTFARDLGRIATTLARILAGEEGERSERLARLILRVDSAHEAAHRALGHELIDGRWMDALQRDCAARRAEIQEAMRAAHRLEVLVDVKASADEVLVGASGGPGVSVRFGDVEVVTQLPPARAERAMQTTLRALALSNFIFTGRLEVPRLAATKWLFLAKREHYEAAARAAIAAGQVGDEYARIALDINGYFDRSGRGVMHTAGETAFVGTLFRYLRRMRQEFESYQPCLQTGHLNWVARGFLGIPLPGEAWFETTEGSGGAPREYDRAVSATEKQERETLLRLAEAGIAGSRAWIAYLAARGEDPRWSDTMLDESGKIQGTHLLKAMHVVEYLQESCDQLLGLMQKTSRGKVGNKGVPAAFAAELGPLDAFERRWREWLLPRGRGLVQRFGGEAPVAGPSASEREALDYLLKLRGQAFERLPFTPPELVIESSLSRGCAAHASYLGRNPEQTKAWPDAHEEYPDRPGFSAEGSWAGLNSVVAPGVRGSRDAIDAWMGTFYHRVPLLEVGLVGMGWGFDAGVGVLDCSSLVSEYLETSFIAWPPADMRDVPRRFRPELPNPVPGADQSLWGYPITLQCSATGTSRPDSGRLSLHKGDESGPVVDCHLSTPAAPTNLDLAPAGAFCLMPKAHLMPSTIYTVVAEIEGMDRLVWSFTTGR